MGLFDRAIDFWDHQVQYYRYYIYRRILFGEYKSSQKGEFSMFANKDYENVDKSIVQSLSYSVGTALIFNTMNACYDIQFKKLPFNTVLTKAAVLFAGAIAVGVMYPLAVTTASNFRGKVNGELNHAIAACVSFPIIGLYSPPKQRPLMCLGYAFWGAIIVMIIKNFNIERETLGNGYIDSDKEGASISAIKKFHPGM